MTELSTEQMLDGLFARHGALRFTVDGADNGVILCHYGTGSVLATGATPTAVVRKAWITERDRLHKALAALGAPVVVDSTPTAPTAWAPMATCPRSQRGVLTEEVWLNSRGNDPVRFGARAVLNPDYDRSLGWLGWLPGYLNRADLPPVEVTP